MGKYENGLSTRRIILDAGRQVFLDKGFHQTSSDDICRAAHVNRSAIYYHFKDKENLRYEILWEFIREYRAIVEPYSAKLEIQLALSACLSWVHSIKDAKIRRFHVDYAHDYPVYIPNQPLPTYYRLLYSNIFGKIWPVEKISALSFSSIYGHIVSVMLLADSEPENFTGKELFLHNMETGMKSWGIPEEKSRDFWMELKEGLEQIPDTIE
ncbi:MAG: TetR/AcrR family transcriptional regulator [Lachnospiraceae bacterium]|nr:TetR/AcrR family transcriptional regulator [Lachnospiraceae bacterium]